MRLHIKRWLRRGSVVALMVGVGLTAGCQNDTASIPAADTVESSSDSSSARNNRSERRQTTSASDKRSPRDDRARRTDPEKDAQVEATMPNVPCGTDLQDAQNLVQDAGVFFSRSEDATGQGRRQILDDNWTVVGHEPAAGQPIGEGTVVFFVVDDEQFNGCDGF